MNNVVQLRARRRSKWAAQHVEFIDTACGQLAECLTALSPEEFAVELAAVDRINAGPNASPAAQIVASIYYSEDERRRVAFDASQPSAT